MKMLLPPERIEIQPIEVNEPRDESPNNQSAEKSEEAEELGSSHAAEPHAEPQRKHEESVENEDLNEEKADKELEEETDESLPTLPDRVKESNRNDSLFTEICEYLANPMEHDRPTVYLRGSQAENELLYKDNKLWVAKDLRLDVIREVHDQPAVRHAGVRRTMLLIQQHFFWPRMKRDVDRYIRNCHVCRQAKAPRD